MRFAANSRSESGSPGSTEDGTPKVPKRALERQAQSQFHQKGRSRQLDKGRQHGKKEGSPSEPDSVSSLDSEDKQSEGKGKTLVMVQSPPSDALLRGSVSVQKKRSARGGSINPMATADARCPAGYVSHDTHFAFFIGMGRKVGSSLYYVSFGSIAVRNSADGTYSCHTFCDVKMLICDASCGDTLYVVQASISQQRNGSQKLERKRKNKNETSVKERRSAFKVAHKEERKADPL